MTLGAALLVLASYPPSEIRALLPAPSIGPGTYLLTVERITGIVAAFDVRVSATDLFCVDGVSAAELDFDPATQDKCSSRPSRLAPYLDLVQKCSSPRGYQCLQCSMAVWRDGPSALGLTRR